jgi:hypothetical protein
VPSENRGRDSSSDGQPLSAKGQSKPERNKWTSIEWLTLVFNAVVAISTVVAVCVYIVQLGTMNQQLSDSERATRNSTRTQILTQLPLIVPINPRIEWNNTVPEGGIFLRDDFKNIGETRAVAPDISVGWGNELPTNGMHYFVHYGDLSKWTWAKGEVKIGTRCLTLADAKMLENEIRTGSKPVYFYVKIQYNDLFPTDKEAGHPRNDHLVESCLKINRMDVDERNKGAHTSWGGIRCAERLDCIDQSCGADYESSAVLSRSSTHSTPDACTSLK